MSTVVYQRLPLGDSNGGEGGGHPKSIEDVVVDSDARGQGIGAALTTEAIARAGDAGARTVDLTSRASRVAANRLYERLGFQPRESQVYRYSPHC
ncbi:GNAT family N-acetyltransferase [Nocardia terpenica]|uniref:GNAT family N-acetyltransferase n=1 Tax=Nocardia terpenica TaxID=455432 RepID=A0A6G9Z4N9_9NOCA|nr:GNAT family N-acetyltransferase [Nocardia terpenica]QIS20361.1 GNAT family N-acetyltransferase [Nocardia terpenica]